MISLSKIQQFIEPTKERGSSVSLFFGTVIGIDGSTLVIEPKAGGVVYATSYVYCELGDLVACLAFGTSIIAFAAKDAKRLEDELGQSGLIYHAGEGIKIDSASHTISADVTEDDLAGKADVNHSHSATDITSGTLDKARLPSIPASKLEGTIPTDNLPSFVDDVLEGTLSTFPATGETGKIYVDTTTNETYRWSGSKYVEISASLALGETSSTAYRGDRGKVAYDHTTRTDNPHKVTPAQIGAAASSHTHSPSDLSSVVPISKGGTGSSTKAGAVDALLGDLPKWDAAFGDNNGLAKYVQDGGIKGYYSGLQIWDYIKTKTDSLYSAKSHTHETANTTAAGFMPKLGGGTSNFLRADGTWDKPPNTTYSNMTGASTSAAGKAGLVPAPSAGAATRYLRSDGTWQVPPNTTYGVATKTANGLLSASDKTKLDGIATGANKYVLPIAGAALGGIKTDYAASGKNYPVKVDSDGSAYVNVPWTDTKTTVDAALSSSSTNPVQNKVINTALAGKASTSHAHTLNGKSVSSPSWYAPRTVGQMGQYLVSSGTGEPVWATVEGGVMVYPTGYPVGSVYLTFDSNFNPAKTFGGSWTKNEETYLFLGITIWRCVESPDKYFTPLDLYPIGTAFLTFDEDRNPASEFGGTWTLNTETYLFLGIKIYKRIS